MLKKSYTGHHKDVEVLSNYFEAFKLMPWPRKILEIGVLNGGSLFLWNDLFAPDLIVGLDNAIVDPSRYQGFPIEVYDFDQKWPEKNPFNKSTKFNLIVDDGVHVKKFTVMTLMEFWKYLADGGVYIVEDWPHYEMEDFGDIIHGLADKLNAEVIKMSNLIIFLK